MKRKDEKWIAPRLDGRIAVVSGATRGAGRGIALSLGEAGATVYVTGRSVRGKPTTGGRPGTVEDTAEEVTARGGRGIAVRCDHSVAADVETLFARVKKEQGYLDILVNNAWGGYEGGLIPAYFWKAPLEQHWQGMFVNGLRTHLVTSYYAIPLMLPRSQGLIVSTIAWDHDKYIGSFYDVSKHAIVRFIYGVARELRKHNIAAIALAPGFMRTEAVLKACKTDEEHWRTRPGLEKTESPEYVGRAVNVMAADPKIMRKYGKAFRVGELAPEYGFTDVDGRRVPPFTIRKPFEKMLEDWKVK